MQKGKYLVMEPSGSMRWEEIDRARILGRLHEIIDCNCVEQVRTVIHNLVLIVDESGRIKTPPKEHNDLASCLYLGWILGSDNIVGTAVLASLEVDPESEYGEMDWFPVNELHQQILKELSFSIPED